FTYNGLTWTPTLAELGASIDVESSVDAAWELGRDESAVDRLGFTRQLLRSDQRVPLRTTVDRSVLASWFTSVNADIDQRAVDASLEVNGADVMVIPERNGTIVDEAAATEMVLGALESLEPLSAELPTQVEHPKIYADDLEGPRADLAAALDAPVLVMFEGRKWDIPPADLAQFLTVETVYERGDTHVELSFDREALATYLRDAFAGQVNRAPVDASIAWSVDQGGLVSLDQSVDGAALRSNAFADAVAESFLGDQSAVEIPVVVTKPEIDSSNLGALGIDGLLARGDSNYDGGKPDRDTNIEVGVKLLNGELVAPGEEFSFNRAVGEITYDKGFVDAGVIEAETIGRDVGGGICQVSTTVFRAALLSGMPMTEWWPHSLRLKGYERDGWTAGFDASILQSGSNPEYWGDFRFKNDTDGYMLVHAWTDYPHVIVEIYGNDDGRTVDISEPKFWKPDGEYEDKEVIDPDKPVGYIEQTQWPTEPYAASFTRTITYADGTTVDRLFESIYEGSGNVWRVSPDMKGKSPASRD
ncbi:MAG TPA: VanW family protein, partial [Thermomicrobiales bacterium]|nr:VanW family protein [Thermomicrobiales bacterium]